MMSPLVKSTSKHDDFKPFFIVGCPRSGTTLLSVLLDRHSSVAVPPETFFFHVFSGVSRQRLMHSVMGNSLEKLGYKNDFDYGSNLDRIQNAIVQIPFNLAFNNRVHPQLQSYRLRLRSLVTNLKG
jgi:hypothetical protein